MHTLLQLFNIFQPYILNKTKIYKYILENKNMSHYIPYIGYPQIYDDKIPSEMDLLINVYKDMIVDKKINDDNNFVIEL